jgi:diguanylate cyclase (GGDEF)-like protein
VALMILDVDCFKKVNDDFGHSAGDAVLRRAAALLSDVVGTSGTCYRYGGDELVALLPGVDEQRAATLADALRARLAEPTAALPDVTASVGVAAATPGAGAHQLLDRADEALRQAKADGRDRVGRASTTAAPPPDDLVERAARRAALALAAAASNAHYPEATAQSDDVVRLCERMADRLGLRGEDREHLLAAARLHDVGKAGIPPEILRKPGPLDATEWAVMYEHTVMGERILESVPELAPVAPLVRHANERWDGTGYPDRLAGDAIPLASRIIFCAGAFHAMRSDRPYRGPRAIDDALIEVEAHAGTQFDPDVAQALVDVVEAGGGRGRGRLLRLPWRRRPRA